MSKELEVRELDAAEVETVSGGLIIADWYGNAIYVSGGGVFTSLSFDDPDNW